MKVYTERFQLVLPKSHGRSVGMHVSDIIRDLALNGGVLDPKWVKGIALEEQNTNMMQLGLAFEDYLGSTQHPEIEFHPGEMYVDVWSVCSSCGKEKADHSFIEDDGHVFAALRIYLSPDGVSLIDSDDYAELFKFSCHFLHEFKLTKKSSRDFAQALRTHEKKVLMWLWQIMAYCYACKTLAAKLHVMFVNGNYSRNEDDPESMPKYDIFRLEFSQEEIDTNWAMLTTHARRMIQHGTYKRAA